MTCDHPFDALEVAQVTGDTDLLILACTACEQRFPRDGAIRQLVASALADHRDLWREIRQLGGGKAAKLAPPAEPVAADKTCAHHLAWLQVQGSRALTWRCAGCRQAWPEASGLKLFLERLLADRSQLKKAVRALGSPTL